MAKHLVKPKRIEKLKNIKFGTTIVGLRKYEYPDDSLFWDGAVMMWEGSFWAYMGLAVAPVQPEDLPTHFILLEEY